MHEQNLPDSLTIERNGPVMSVQLARPAKRNAINDEMILGLERLFTTIPDGVGAVVLAGEGEHFSAGLNLSELRERDAMEGFHHSRIWHREIECIQSHLY